MIKAAMLGSWACAILLASQYGVTRFVESRSEAKAAAPLVKLETRKTNEISVPKIKNGIVRGYVVVRLNYVVDVAAMASARVAPDIFINDELFRYIYSDDTIDFSRLENFNLRKLYASLMESTNERLKAKVITDIAVQMFTFVPTAEARRAP